MRRLTSTLLDDGASFSGLERNHLFVNQAGRNFVNLSGVSGLDSLADARTNVRFDFDRDGFSDVGMVNANAPFFNVYRNTLGDRRDANRFIAIRLKGGNRQATKSTNWSARDGIGALIRVHVGDKELLREQRAGEGFGGQNSKTMLVGLGQHDRATSIKVAWPSGRQQRIESVRAGMLLTVYEDETEHKGGFNVSPYKRDGVTPRLAKSEIQATLPVAVDQKAQLSIYVTFATWCQSCRQELPGLREVLAQFAPGTVAAFGVPIDPRDTPQQLASWLAQYRPPLRLLNDISEQQRTQLAQFVMQRTASETAVPCTIIVDKNGTVRAVFPGPPTLSQIRELLDS